MDVIALAVVALVVVIFWNTLGGLMGMFQSNAPKRPNKANSVQWGRGITAADKEEVKPFIVHGDVMALHTYHPFRQRTNPNFDDISKRIFDMKGGKPEAIMRFADELNSVVPQEVVVCIVPASRSGYADNSPIGLVAKMLCKGKRTDGSRCLRRNRSIDKLSRGGKRDRSVHAATVDVRSPELLAGNVVWLLDDVVSTGNSLKACAEILKANGAKEVHCIAIGATVKER